MKHADVRYLIRSSSTLIPLLSSSENRYEYGCDTASSMRQENQHREGHYRIVEESLCIVDGSLILLFDSEILRQAQDDRDGM